jgi:hypothetical protein
MARVLLVGMGLVLIGGAVALALSGAGARAGRLAGAVLLCGLVLLAVAWYGR